MKHQFHFRSHSDNARLHCPWHPVNPTEKEQSTDENVALLYRKRLPFSLLCNRNGCAAL